MLFLVMVHVKKFWVISSHIGIIGEYHCNNESCWGSIGIIGDNIIAKLMEVVGLGLKKLIHQRNNERFEMGAWPMTFMI